MLEMQGEYSEIIQQLIVARYDALLTQFGFKVVVGDLQ